MYFFFRSSIPQKPGSDLFNMARTSFHWADYLVFALSLVLSLLVGLFFCIQGKRRKSTNDDFLMGERNINPISVGLSLAASLLNAVFLIGLILVILD